MSVTVEDLDGFRQRRTGIFLSLFCFPVDRTEKHVKLFVKFKICFEISVVLK